MHAIRLMSKRVTLSVAGMSLGALILATATAGLAVSLTRSKVHPVWANGTIHQCVNNKTYVTRTMPRGRHCSAKETAFSFNQSGRTGAAGLSASAFADDNAGGSAKVPSGDLVIPAKQATIKLTKPGKVIVLDATLYSASFDNTSNVTQHYLELVLVDNRSVPGALPSPFQFEIPPQSTYDVSGFTTPPGSLAVGAGTHHITIAFVTSDTTSNFMTGSSGRILAVATG